MSEFSSTAAIVTFTLLVLFILVPVFSTSFYGPAIQFALETVAVAGFVVGMAWWLTTGFMRA
jgi:hypothetical protein